MSSPYTTTHPHQTDEKKLSTEHIEHNNDNENEDPENALDEKHAAGAKKKGVNTQLDDAAALLEAHGGHVEYTAEENKRILRMVDLYVCVPVSPRSGRRTLCVYGLMYLGSRLVPRRTDVSSLLAPTTRQILRLLCRSVRSPRIHQPDGPTISLVILLGLCRPVGLSAVE